MNKRQLLQTYASLYESYKTNGKLSKKKHNQAIWLIKTIYQIELENQSYIEKMLNKTKHMITVKTKTRANDDYNQQIKTLKKQCGYTYDCFNFVTLLEQAKPKQVKKNKNKKKKASKQALRLLRQVKSKKILTKLLKIV